MSDREGIFAGDDPFGLVRSWMEEATATEPNDPNAMALATVDAAGLPNVRIVLLKEVSADGFVFFTNYGSAKGTELDAAGKAALVLHWKTLGRQVRARGTVARVPPEVSDAYYRSRPLDSRIGAWASKQSRPLESRGALEAAVIEARRTHGENPPRPEHWGGYLLTPVEIEFWADGPHRLHDRFLWVKENTDDGWSVSRLNP